MRLHWRSCTSSQAFQSVSRAHPTLQASQQSALRRQQQPQRLAAVAQDAAEVPPAMDKPCPTPAKTYQQASIGEALDKDYGVVKGGPSRNRRAGVILHPTSLPGPYGSGEIGSEAFRFVDWLVSAGMQIWQVLPLVPPEEFAWSPYSGLDALCGNVLLISLDGLAQDGLLSKQDLPKAQPVGNADFPTLKDTKMPLLNKAADALLALDKGHELRQELVLFHTANPWVKDSALFHALTTFHPSTKDKAWWTWEDRALRSHDKKAIDDIRTQYAEHIERFIALQYLFDRQWTALKAYANDRGISIMGDMPIYVGGQSADVWAYQDLFELSADGAPVNVSGVPPDAFSETGQLWGSPLYDWQAHSQQGYKWWVQRLSRAFQVYDETRIDHFRGFAGYYSVDAKAETAIDGEWRKGPGKELFDALEKELGHVPIVAEDLGVITDDVNALRVGIGAPGMVVLQFAWGSGGTNIHLPHNHYENSVCYPGTHDNETMVGWWKGVQDKEDRKYVQQYTDQKEVKDIAWTTIRLACRSVSQTCIFQMQDVMRLDNSARMNFPGTVEGNWSWRVGDEKIWGKLAQEAKDLRALCTATDRLPPGAPAEAEKATKTAANVAGSNGHASNGHVSKNGKPAANPAKAAA